MSTRDEPIGALEDWTALLDDVEEPPMAAPVAGLPPPPKLDAPRMQADGSLLAEFIDALFRYADEDTFVSLRAFQDDRDGVFGIRPVRLGGGLERLAAAAER